MPQAIYILFGAAFTVAVCLAGGRILLRGLSIRLYRQEELVLAFVTGAACLSLLIFLLCAVGAARQRVFLAAGIGVLALAFFGRVYALVSGPRTLSAEEIGRLVGGIVGAVIVGLLVRWLVGDEQREPGQRVRGDPARRRSGRHRGAGAADRRRAH